MDKKIISIQHIEKLSIYCIDKNNSSIQHMENVSIYCMDKLSIYHIEKDISDNTEQVPNKYIDMTYLRKRYMNI